MLKYFADIDHASTWPLISLCLFFSAFIVISIWAYRRRAADHYRRMAHFALDSDQPSDKELDHGRR